MVVDVTVRHEEASEVDLEARKQGLRKRESIFSELPVTTVH